MAFFKCKMCGGILKIVEGETVITCEYCGTKQTIPQLYDEKRARLFEHADHFRRNFEFAKAEAIYEQILNEDFTDAEVYWSLVLCRYGIQYVEDPKTLKRVPTVNRIQKVSVFDDENYRSAIKYADPSQRLLYEAEAKLINEIHKEFVKISSSSEPFDVFICYKDLGENQERTDDSVIAEEIYNELKKQGVKAFFSRITLEDKLGSDYESLIFSALNSARVMIVVGTNREYLESVWVKNEWKRYLGAIKNGDEKALIPVFKNMSAGELPPEFSHLQAQDMAKIGAMQDLTRGVKKLLDNAPASQNKDGGKKNSKRKPFVYIFVAILAIAVALSLTLVLLLGGKNGNEPDGDATLPAIEHVTEDTEVPDESETLAGGDTADETEQTDKADNTDNTVQDDNSNSAPEATQEQTDKTDDTDNTDNTEQASYVVNHYKESLDGSGEYLLFKVQALVGDDGETVTPNVSDLDGFESPDAQSVTLKLGEERSVDYYYDRKNYELKLVMNTGAEKTVSQKYGSRNALDAWTTRDGYSFGGWFTDVELTKPYDSDFLEFDGITAYAYWLEENKPSDFSYTVKDGEYVIINGYSGEAVDVVIPAYIGGLPVAEIAQNCFEGNTALRSISLPKTLVKIGANAFLGCTALEGVELEMPEGWQCFANANATDGTDISLAELASRASAAQCLKNTYCEYFWSLSRTTTSEGLAFVREGDGYSVSGIGSCDDAYIIIPSTYEGLPVISIGDEAFANCTGILSVYIPKSVGNIGARAFEACVGLEKINLFEGITNIGERAFAGCKSLSSLTLPSSVSEIASNAFSSCDSLVRVIIGSGVNVISEGAFDKCYKLIEVINKSSLEIKKGEASNGGVAKYALEVHNQNSKIITKGEYQFYTVHAQDYLVNYIGESENITLPDGYNGQRYAINEYAFFNKGGLIKSVVIPDKVSLIEANAFACSGVSSLLSVSLGNTNAWCVYQSATEQGEENLSLEDVANAELMAQYLRADYLSCRWEKILTYSEGLVYAKNPDGLSYSVTGIGGCADSEIVIPRTYDGLPVTEIGENAFYGCISIESVILPNTIKAIRTNAFFNCYCLSDIRLPDSITVIEGAVFKSCTELKRVNLPKGLTEISQNLFDDCIALESIHIPNTVESIGDYAFYRCERLEEVILPEAVKSIGRSAFYNCCLLRSVNIPDGVSVIKEETFYECSVLESIALPNSVEEIKADAFTACAALNGITLGNRVKIIGINAFYSCRSLTSITLGESLETISDSAFSNCFTLVEVINKSKLDIKKGDEDNGCVAYYAFDVHNGDSRVVTQGNFRFYTFEGVNYLIDYIGRETALRLPLDYNGETYVINDYAFASFNYTYNGIRSIVVPNCVTAIGKRSFYWCAELVSLTLGNGIESIGDNAFSGCKSLKEIVIPKSVTKIGKSIFLDGNPVNSITFEEPDGWWVFENENATSGVEILAADIQDKTTIRSYLNSTYSNYYWRRNPESVNG